MELFRVLMSQAGSIQGGGGPVGPAIETVTGNSGGAVSPTANNINVVFDGQSSSIPPSGFTAIGNLVASTLTLEQFLYSAVTVGAVSSAILTIPLAANQMVIANLDVLVFRADQTIGGGAAGFLTARSTGGVVRPLSQTINITGDPTINSNMFVRIAASGANAVIFVQSNLPDTYNWSAYIRYHLQ